MNVVLSVALLLSFVTNSIGMLTQRYLAFAIGENSFANLRRFHDTCFFLTLASAAFIFVILQTGGNWFVSDGLVVEFSRQDEVEALFQFFVLSTVCGAIAMFHASVMLAHEDMFAFAFFAFLTTLFRLGAALSISAFNQDGLVIYGFFFFLATLSVMLAQWIYCVFKYDECKLRGLSSDTQAMREMLGFLTWTLFGQFTTVCRTQAITLLINQAFNPTTVAARALAFTIQAQVQTFSQNFIAALNPPITKSFASGAYEQTRALVYMGSKAAFFLAWIVTLPLIALLRPVLSIWIGDYPPEALLFTRLALIESLIVSASFPLMTAVRAAGKVRTYELVLGSLQVLIFLLSWLLVSTGFPAYSVYVVAILMNILMLFVRLTIASRMVGLSVWAFFDRALMPIFKVVTSSSIIVISASALVFEAGFTTISLGSVVGLLAILGAAPTLIYCFGLTSGERAQLKILLRSILAKRAAK
ncbi:hypothetical protein [Yoonia litorea]|nr:hypothetical protein [Yoonia litorea]